MKPDILQRSDIEMLINSFYKKVRKDDVLAIIFNDVVRLDWEHHIPVIIDFWDTVLLDADLYHNNAMTPHFAINKIFPLQQQHFDRWLQLFFETLDESFEGPTTMLAKTRAKGVAGIMKINMDALNK
jgi:hemoglobin